MCCCVSAHCTHTNTYVCMMPALLFSRKHALPFCAVFLHPSHSAMYTAGPSCVIMVSSTVCGASSFCAVPSVGWIEIHRNIQRQPRPCKRSRSLFRALLHPNVQPCCRLDKDQGRWHVVCAPQYSCCGIRSHDHTRACTHTHHMPTAHMLTRARARI